MPKRSLVAALIPLTLAALGGSAGSVVAAGPADPTEPSGPATRTVVHELGTSEVPVDPQRIVVVDRRGTLAFAFELGFEPVGALDATWFFDQPFHPLITERAEAAGVVPIESADGINVEQVVALDPDLIIGMVVDIGDAAEQLEGIAPTIGLDWDWSSPVNNVLVIGEALGRPEEAQALADEYNDALAAAAAETPSPGTVSIVMFLGADNVRIHREAYVFGQIVTALGGEVVPDEETLPFEAADNDEVNFVSLEEIGLASGDRLLALVNVDSWSDEAYRDLSAQPIVQTLPAFQSGQVLEIDPQLAIGSAGMAGLHAALEQLVDFFSS